MSIRKYHQKPLALGLPGELHLFLDGQHTNISNRRFASGFVVRFYLQVLHRCSDTVLAQEGVGWQVCPVLLTLDWAHWARCWWQPANPDSPSYRTTAVILEDTHCKKHTVIVRQQNVSCVLGQELKASRKQFACLN